MSYRHLIPLAPICQFRLRFPESIFWKMVIIVEEIHFFPILNVNINSKYFHSLNKDHFFSFNNLGPICLLQNLLPAKNLEYLLILDWWIKTFQINQLKKSCCKTFVCTGIVARNIKVITSFPPLLMLSSRRKDIQLQLHIHSKKRNYRSVTTHTIFKELFRRVN